jgi:hypothetical protein
LPIVIYHQVLEVVNETGDKHAEVEQLVTVPAHVECTRLAPLWHPRHVKAASQSINETADHKLRETSLHHVTWITTHET